ncbi:hexitol phosphatase HxpB [Caviibacterium pharyngocola]|uniref:Phosphatase n=1 Tax=Caviibacterium pharyngocola TaxID=28159 RepID=A0A2M8RSN5_9PAST|nr:hexitol phosphatase HxpB [Caviibacterium pharyngocola]PJG81901.1 phosphatase [Caviibacterium pharyngocola]
MTIQAVIFDMDGVLIDSEPLWKQAGVDIFNAFDIPATWADMVALTGLPSLAIAKTMYQRHNKSPIPPEDMATRINDYAISLILAKRPLMPGVKETLEKLHRLGYKMAIASASPRKLLAEITEKCGIADYFGYLSSATELDYNKPHPQVYLHAAKMLGVEAKNCIGIEDSVVGMTAVKAASMSCIVIPDASARNDKRWSLADAQLNSLTDINETLLRRFD